MKDSDGGAPAGKAWTLSPAPRRGDGRADVCGEGSGDGQGIGGGNEDAGGRL